MLILALLLVLANGFFVALEFALVKVRPSRLQALADEGRPGATSALKVVGQLDTYLSATQFGITLASLGLGWLGEPAFARLLESVLSRTLTAETAARLSHSLSLAVAFILITFLHIVLGELAPKSLAIQRAEKVSLTLAGPMRLFYGVFFPWIWLLNSLARWVVARLGLGIAADSAEAHNEDELRIILQSSARSGVMPEQRAKLLERALSLGEKTAKQVLVPRSQVVFLDLEEPLEKNIAEAREAGHTWIPVVRGNLDQVEGLVNVKDLFYLLSTNQLRSLAQVQWSVLFVPESATLEQLLTEFRRRKRQMAVVVDEHGGTSGIVTLADVVAEVVGDVAELGRKVEEVRTLPGGRLEVAGSTPLDDLEHRLGVSFGMEPGEVSTVGGFLMAKLNRIPVFGDRVAVGEFEVVVEEMQGPRVLKVRIQPKSQVPVIPPIMPENP